jgi:transposase
MFLRSKTRKKDGKVHRTFSVVENRRLPDGRVAQRHVLYLGEINDAQHRAWCKTIEVVEGAAGKTSQMAIFPEDRIAPPMQCEVAQVRVKDMRLVRPRQWGACWLALELWEQLDLDRFWAPRLMPSREGTRWLNVLKTLVVYRLIDPGSEWRLHRQWFDRSAMGDLLDEDVRIAQANTLYRCLDLLVEHKQALFSHLKERWETLFRARFEVLLYDLTSTYFECDADLEPAGLKRFGYSRDKRPDCVQVIIALVVTPEGFPLAYEVMGGNTADNTTLEGFVQKIQDQYGAAERIWIMDRGIPTDAALQSLRARSPAVRYLVGTPKGRLSALEREFLCRPWEQAREHVHVKLLERDNEVYVLARSTARLNKERAMRRRVLKRLIKHLHELRAQELTRDQVLMKLGAAKTEAGNVWWLLNIVPPPRDQPRMTNSFQFSINRQKLRQARLREGRYLLRSNLTATAPATLWTFYIQLTEVEQAFKELKNDLSVRPIYHQLDRRIEAHIFVAFLAYCLQVTLKARLRPLAGGLTPRSVIEKFAGIQMLDVHLPLTDGRALTVTRYTEPEKEHQLLLRHMHLALPCQPPPRISAPI